MDKAVLDLLAFYQKELAECEEAEKATKRLNIASADVAHHFQLGYCSGRAWQAASDERKKFYRRMDLAHASGERFSGCIVFPATNEAGMLVDLFGLRPVTHKKRKRIQARSILWQTPPQGHINVNAITTHSEIILTDFVPYALAAVELGYRNVVPLRSADELGALCRLLKKHETQRVYLLTPQRGKELVPRLEQTGIELVRLQRPRSVKTVADSLTVIGTLPLQASEAFEATLSRRTENRLFFTAGEASYQLESLAVTGLGMRVRVKATHGKASFLDKLDLASSQARKKFARPCGMELGLPSSEIERHLNSIADKLDEMELEEAAKHTRAPRVLTQDEEKEALSLLKGEDILSRQANMLGAFGFVGEEANKRLALLVAASRLLDKPLGAIVRGPAGCGKSALIGAVAKALPLSEVLYFSRMTAQSLYFLPREHLHHKLLVCDEYEGLENSEYALRTMMSSQTLSLAITVREGGRVPVTRTVEIPATLSILVSTTGSVNIENLSRFIELSLDVSPDQTTRVMARLARESVGSEADSGRIRVLRNAQQLLKPCGVELPFADSLVYASGNVLARRQFAQVVGLISSHAALYQHQRDSRMEGGRLIVTATRRDYEAVYPLLASVVDHFEESLSPPALQLLSEVERRAASTFTLKDILSWMGWSYSKAYRVTRELAAVDLLIPDKLTNGVERRFEAAPYFRTERGISQIAPPAR